MLYVCMYGEEKIRAVRDVTDARYGDVAPTDDGELAGAYFAEQIRERRESRKVVNERHDHAASSLARYGLVLICLVLL